MAADGTVKILIQADGEEAISSVDDLVKRLDGIGSAGKKAGGLLKSVLGANLIGNAITTGISAIKNGLAGLGSDLSESSAAWQTFEGNMKNLKMPDSQITATKAELQKFAQQTIYSASDMASTYSQLAAVGTKNTTQLVKGFGGLAAASEDPTQAMKTLSQQATQMAAKPKVAWEDFKLMLEQSPAGMAAVAKTMGMSTGQLITKIQAGTVATDDFFAAVAKTGTNATFSKMATQYKTVGQAMDGLRETLVNKLQPSFDTLSAAGINAISKLTDALGGLDFTGLANAAVAALNGIATAIEFMVKHADELKAAGVAVGAFLAAFMVARTITSFNTQLAAAGSMAKLLTQSLTKVKTVFAGLMKVLGVGPWGLVIAAIAAVVVGLTYFFTKTQTGQALWAKFVAWIQKAVPIFTLLASAISRFVSAGLAKLAPILTQAGTAINNLVSGSIAKLGPMLVSMGGAFGALGALVGPVVSILTKVGLAALGISGPWGIAIGVVTSFLGMWAKTGQLNASGITQVFTGLSATITNVANTISQYLPRFITMGTNILVSMINGITAALPQIVNAALAIINGLTVALVAVLPQLVTAGVQILTFLIQGIVTVLPLLITAALQIIMALFNGLIAALPTLISAGIQILTALINGIVQMLPMIINAALQVIMALFNGLIAALPTIINAGIQILMALINGIIQILPQLISAALEIITSLATALIKNLPKIINAGIRLLTALINGLIKVLPQLVSAAFKIVTALFTALVSNAPKILAAGVKLIMALISGIGKLIGAVGSAALKIGGKVISAIGSKAKSMVSAGVDFVKGFIGGIGSMVNNVVKTAENMGKKAVDGVKKFLHIGSPSRVMRQIGVWTGQGFTNGMKAMLPRVASMSDRMAAAALIDTPDTSFGALIGTTSHGAERLFSGTVANLPSAQTVNNYTTNNTQGGMTDKALALLQTIADKSPVISGSSVVPALSPFLSQQQQVRQNLANRGATVNVTL
jgi:tape measure domain-containing protein